MTTKKNEQQGNYGLHVIFFSVYNSIPTTNKINFFVAIRNYNKSEKIDALLRDYLLDCFYLRLDSISILFVTSKNKDSPQDSYHRNTKKQNMSGSQCDS